MSDAEVGKRVGEILNRIYGSTRNQFKRERAELKKLLAENQGGAATKAYAHWSIERYRKKHAAERVLDEATKIVEGRCNEAPSGDLLEFAEWIVDWMRPAMPARPPGFSQSEADAFLKAPAHLSNAEAARYARNHPAPAPRPRRPRKLPSNVIPFRRPVKKIASAHSGDGPKAAS